VKDKMKKKKKKKQKERRKMPSDFLCLNNFFGKIHMLSQVFFFFFFLEKKKKKNLFQTINKFPLNLPLTCNVSLSQPKIIIGPLIIYINQLRRCREYAKLCHFWFKRCENFIKIHVVCICNKIISLYTFQPFSDSCYEIINLLSNKKLQKLRIYDPLVVFAHSQEPHPIKGAPFHHFT
jgi:hypothetical protein